jgi:hypothetical protein
MALYERSFVKAPLNKRLKDFFHGEMIMALIIAAEMMAAVIILLLV